MGDAEPTIAQLYPPTADDQVVVFSECSPHCCPHLHTATVQFYTTDFSLPTLPMPDDVPILKLLQLATACIARATGQTG